MKVLAAYRLALVARQVPMNHVELVRKMRSRCGCNERLARHYLSSDDWDVDRAVKTYKEEQSRGLIASQSD
jgi:hypothetical protein